MPTQAVDPHPRPLTREAVSGALADQLHISGIWSGRRAVVVRGRLPDAPAHRQDEIELRLAELGWTVRIEPTGSEYLLFVESARQHRFPWMPILLFAATVLTVVVLRPLMLTGFQWEYFWDLFWEELPFAYALFPILLAHEFGHYFAARAHRYPASLPYFIPGFYPFGTFGAVIVARYPFRNRRVLFDVAVAGPIAGFIACIPVLWYGLSHSAWIHVAEAPGIVLGDPLLMKLLASLALPPPPGPDMDILLHAAAFGGWAGLFVTMLNLLPFGPLDGGKTAYALYGRRQKWIAVAVWGLLSVTLLVSYFWVLWLALALVFRLPHPPTLNDDEPLGERRRVIGWVVVAVFVLSFMPLPFKALP